MASELKGGETVLTGLLEDRSALFGVVAQIEALGLELLELRQIQGEMSETAGRSIDGDWNRSDAVPGVDQPRLPTQRPR
jgi:hypothetical protein